jgi:pimeloyl-ACP methyl ester carboxylesterase
LIRSAAPRIFSSNHEETHMTPDAFASLRKTIDTSFGRIATYECGSGPAALFVHGYPLSAYHWRHQLAALSDIRRCIAVDLLGLGYTEPLPGTRVGYPEQARMLSEVADVLGLEAFDLIGNDSGGSISQLLAVAAPERIRSLTLTNCEVGENNPPAALVPLVETARAGQLPGLFDAMSRDLEAARGGFAAVFARPELAISAERLAYDVAPLLASEPRRRWLVEYLLELSPDVTLGVLPDLERFERPVLLVWGDDDPYMPVASARWLEAHVPGVRRLVLVEGGKLFFPEEEHALLNAELRTFWQTEA